jgi:formate dehydrogenase subunit gamma
LKAEAIPLEAVPLHPRQAGEMLQRRLKKHHVAIILLHWFNATTWLLELVTGAALVSSDRFRVVPAWYPPLVTDVFGSRAGMLKFHIALGLVWIGVFLFYGVFGFRTYLGREVIQREMVLDADDRRWLAVRALRILGRSREPLPPQGIYNAGQKLFGWLVYVMLPVIMITGLLMTFRFPGTAVVGWAVVIHFAAVGAVVAGLIVHLYMGAVFPEEKPAFFSMLTGTVDELYAYRHHFKWWREMKAEEAEWLDRNAPASEPKPAVAEPEPAAAAPETKP